MVVVVTLCSYSRINSTTTCTLQHLTMRSRYVAIDTQTLKSLSFGPLCACNIRIYKAHAAALPACLNLPVDSIWNETLTVSTELDSKGET